MNSIKLRDGKILSGKPPQINDRLRAVRLTTGLSQKDMSETLDLSDGGYKSYELGHRDIPLKVVLRVIQKYDLDAEWFLFGDDGRDTSISNKGAER